MAERSERIYGRGQATAFVGGWCTPAQKAKLAALAQLRGQSVNRTLVRLIDDAAARALGGLEEDPGATPAAAKQNRGAMSETQRAAVPA